MSLILTEGLGVAGLGWVLENFYTFVKSPVPVCTVYILVYIYTCIIEQLSEN